MPQTFQRDRFTWLAYAFLSFCSFFLNGLGPITPFLKEELKLSYTVSSLHFSAFAVGMLLVGLAGHIVIRRVGRWQAAWIGAFGVALSTMLLLAGRSPLITVGAAFCMGLVGSLILVVVPSALADRHGQARAVAIAEANVFASLAGAAAPLLVGLCARLPGGWRLAFGIVACTPVLMRLLLPRVSPQPTGSGPETFAPARRPLPRLYWVYWAALALAVSVEFCMISWSADYMEKSLGMPKTDAVQAVGIFLAAMIVGRLAGSRLVHRLSTPRVAMASILVAGAGFGLFWATGLPLLGLVGLGITGLGVASLYPMILSLMIGAANGDANQASARAILASGSAILALPLLLGRLADLAGIRQAYGVVVVPLIGVFVIVLLTESKVMARQPV